MSTAQTVRWEAEAPPAPATDTANPPAPDLADPGFALETDTPFGALKALLEPLCSGALDDTPLARARYHRLIRSEMRRLERLVGDLLAAAAVHPSDGPGESRRVDLSALVAFRIQEAAEDGARGRLSLRAPDAAVTVHADPARVEQVLATLLSNALHGSPPGDTVEVTVSTTPEQAVVSVRDEGPGIPAAEQARMFDPFHRMEARGGRRGLGLHVARHLIEAMGGRLWVVSQPGSGAIFSFALPLDGTPASIPVRAGRSRHPH